MIYQATHICSGCGQHVRSYKQLLFHNKVCPKCGYIIQRASNDLALPPLFRRETNIVYLESDEDTRDKQDKFIGIESIKLTGHIEIFFHGEKCIINYEDIQEVSTANDESNASLYLSTIHGDVYVIDESLLVKTPEFLQILNELRVRDWVRRIWTFLPKIELNWLSFFMSNKLLSEKDFRSWHDNNRLYNISTSRNLCCYNLSKQELEPFIYIDEIRDKYLQIISEHNDRVRAIESEVGIKKAHNTCQDLEKEIRDCLQSWKTLRVRPERSSDSIYRWKTRAKSLASSIKSFYNKDMLNVELVDNLDCAQGDAESLLEFMKISTPINIEFQSNGFQFVDVRSKSAYPVLLFMTPSPKKSMSGIYIPPKPKVLQTSNTLGKADRSNVNPNIALIGIIFLVAMVVAFPPLIALGIPFLIIAKIFIWPTRATMKKAGVFEQEKKDRHRLQNEKAKKLEIEKHNLTRKLYWEVRCREERELYEAKRISFTREDYRMWRKSIIPEISSLYPSGVMSDSHRVGPTEELLMKALCRYFNHVYNQFPIDCDDYIIHLDLVVYDQDKGIFVNIEADGHQHFIESRLSDVNKSSQMRDDKKREMAVLQKGWIIIRFTNNQIRQSAESCAEIVKSVIKQYDESKPSNIRINIPQDIFEKQLSKPTICYTE